MQQFSVFCFFQSCKRLATTRIWVSQNRGKYCKVTVKTKGCGSGGVTEHIYIYMCMLCRALSMFPRRGRSPGLGLLQRHGGHPHHSDPPLPGSSGLGRFCQPGRGIAGRKQREPPPTDRVAGGLCGCDIIRARHRHYVLHTCMHTCPTLPWPSKR